PNVPDPRRGLDVEGRAVSDVTAITEPRAEAPHAVARHRRRRSVGVRQGEREGCRPPAADADQTVGADAEPPIAHARRLDRPHGSIQLVDEEEIVPAGLVLAQAEATRHAASRYAP